MHLNEGKKIGEKNQKYEADQIAYSHGTFRNILVCKSAALGTFSLLDVFSTFNIRGIYNTWLLSTDFMNKINS